jgi:hypothetical protein
MLRVVPEVQTDTHHAVATGHADQKFGPARRAEALDRRARLVEAEAELLIGVAGRDGVVRVRLDLGDDPQHHREPFAGVAVQPLDLVEVVDHARDAQPGDLRELRLGLRVAVEDDLPRLVARPAREVELSGGRDVDREPFLAEDPQHLGAGERLGRERHGAAPAVVRGHRADELARPSP